MRIARALVLCLLPSLAGGQPVETVQLLHRFETSPSQPSGALLQVPDGSFYGLTSDAIYRLAPGGQVTIVARLTDGFGAAGALVRGPDGALYGITQFGGSGGRGTVFRFDPATSEARTLHAFDGINEGATPVGGLVVVAGQLYGVTAGMLDPGFHGGAIFQMDPATGATVVRHQFLDTNPASPTRAIRPSGPLALGPDGRLYGTTMFGASTGGALYRFDPAPGGFATVVHQFTDPDIEAPAGALLLAPDGMFYGAAQGSQSRSGAVYRFDPATNDVTVVRPFATTGARRPGGVVMTADGSLYGTCSFVGNSGQVVRAGVFRLLPGSFALHPVDILDVETEGAGGGTPLTLGADGLLYGSAQTAGPADAGTLFRFDPAIVPTQVSVLHAFASTTTWAPSAPAPGGDGFLYGTTSRGGANRGGAVYRLDATTGQVTIVSDMPGPGVPGADVSNSTLTLGLDGLLYGTVTISTRTVTRYRVVRVNPGSGVVSVAAETMPAAVGPVASALARASNGRLYFTLARGPDLLRFDPTTNAITTAWQATSPVPAAIHIFTPLLVATDGQLYVALTTITPLNPGSSYAVRVLRIDVAADDVVEVASLQGTTGVSGLVQGLDGALYLSPYFDDVLRLDIATGAVARACTIYAGPSFGIASLTAAADGTLVALLDGGTFETLQLLGRCAPSTGAVTMRAFPKPLGRLPRSPMVSAGGLLYAATWDFPDAPLPGTTAPASDRPGGALVRLGESGSLPALDPDGDGLPTAWETAYGLDPFAAGGAAGANGDPDGDGRTNAEELADGTHPRGVLTRYFAEGATGAFFHTQFDLANPGGGRAATVQFRFMTDAGVTVSHDVVMGPAGHLAVDPSTIPGLANATFSTIVEADRTIAVDRTMTWDASAYGRHLETGIAAPSTTWYFAEGSTSGAFALFYLLQNPHPTATTASVRYLRPGGLPPIERSYVLAPSSRTTIVVDADADLASTDVSAAITATAPIIAERAMYFNHTGQPFAAGHESSGVTAPALDWFLAEGATGDFFDLFLLIANPGASPANVQVEYLLIGGGAVTKTYTVPAAARTTIYVDAEQVPAGSGLRPLANQALSMVVRSTNGVPIVVERTMWWPGPSMTANYWYEAHNSPGATTTATRWVVAGGEAHGSALAATYVLVANPSSTPARVVVTRLLDNTSYVLTGPVIELPPKSRTNVPFPTISPLAPIERFSVLVESLGTSPVPIVVEYATYASPGGVTWASGGNALAAPLP